ncbi:MAG: hypothetical protein EZS28_010214 [Streblomastix strix]|uniref:JAB1/MPN/MOV34 metalloenzyme domain-containing protein n=1 Tax=Streblomastix strix TaxID=222440 RepID=A0A5J4WGW2_9EUKA|nr:MAG: hypothetical protein EZS28_010214 [Streblomastix strix]
MTTRINQNDRNYIYNNEVKANVQSVDTWIIHAYSGGIKEITGQLLGKVERNTFIIIDSYALPVEETETRANPQMQAYAYLAAYKYVGKALGRKEETVG